MYHLYGAFLPTCGPAIGSSIMVHPARLMKIKIQLTHANGRFHFPVIFRVSGYLALMGHHETNFSYNAST